MQTLVLVSGTYAWYAWYWHCTKAGWEKRRTCLGYGGIMALCLEPLTWCGSAPGGPSSLGSVCLGWAELLLAVGFTGLIPGCRRPNYSWYTRWGWTKLFLHPKWPPTDFGLAPVVRITLCAKHRICKATREPRKRIVNSQLISFSRPTWCWECSVCTDWRFQIVTL